MAYSKCKQTIKHSSLLPKVNKRGKRIRLKLKAYLCLSCTVHNISGHFSRIEMPKNNKIKELKQLIALRVKGAECFCTLHFSIFYLIKKIKIMYSFLFSSQFLLHFVLVFHVKFQYKIFMFVVIMWQHVDRFKGYEYFIQATVCHTKSKGVNPRAQLTRGTRPPHFLYLLLMSPALSAL